MWFEFWFSYFFCPSLIVGYFYNLSIFFRLLFLYDLISKTNTQKKDREKKTSATFSSDSSICFGTPFMNMLVVSCVLFVLSIMNPSPHEVLRASLNISVQSNSTGVKIQRTWWIRFPDALETITRFSSPSEVHASKTIYVFSKRKRRQIIKGLQAYILKDTTTTLQRMTNHP